MVCHFFGSLIYNFCQFRGFIIAILTSNFEADHDCDGENYIMLDVVLDRLADGLISGMQYEQWCLRLQRMKEVGDHDF